MFNKILIANRGEIAVRIIRACKELDIGTVAVFSEVDRGALHTQLADEAICIGGNKPQDSYLNMQNIICAACVTKAQALHPGFGFLAENATFATMCNECNITFIGPKPETIDLMGDKANARKLMKSANVPVIPGSEGLIFSIEEAKEEAEKLGYPVMLKATAGGGGRGIRIARDYEQLVQMYHAAKTEAKTAFGDDGIYLEKVIENARHIEVQILGDSQGNIIHLGERDCSLQRRNQKILEEAPSVVISNKKRQELGQIAIAAAKAAQYQNAGTIEFLYDKNDNFYFMEMNTRVQVEHPVTEMVTGIDIIKEQIRIAAGMPLSVKQSDVKISGHAIECRINAENPDLDFAPSPGTVNYLFLPAGGLGLRVDSAMFAGYTIPPYYDSMIAKIIAHGSTRQEAISKMKRALSELVIEGVSTNVDFQLDLLGNKNFISGKVDTSFLQRMLESKATNN